MSNPYWIPTENLLKKSKFSLGILINFLLFWRFKVKSLIYRFSTSVETILLRVLVFIVLSLPLRPLYSCVLTTRTEVLERISENHPILSTTEERLEVLKAGVMQARQVPNPIFNFTSNHGSQGGLSSSETAGNLLYVFELGGKQSSRADFAKAQEKLGRLQVINQTEQILIDSSLMLSRLEQVQTLLGLYKESLEVFIKMGKSLDRNKQLSPRTKNSARHCGNGSQ